MWRLISIINLASQRMYFQGALTLPAERRCIESILMRNWMQRGALACLLWPISAVFGLLVRVRRSLYRAGMFKVARLPVPVIVVGNIFIGGTGKTPLTIWLVRQLRQAGYVPGVVSRGYGAAQKDAREVGADSVFSQVGDEPILIADAAHCPVMVGRNRGEAARALLAAHPEVNVIVLDDGLQHYAVHRDIEIAVFDERGFGNAWMLPAGPLREPASRGADFIVCNGERIPNGMPLNTKRMHVRGDVAERLADRTQRLPLSSFYGQDRKIVAAAGIGNPERFFSMLRAAGLAFRGMPLPDHFDFSGNPFAQLQADVILITEKDAVKCRQIDTLKNDARLWVVPVTAQLDGALADNILEKLRGSPTA